MLSFDISAVTDRPGTWTRDGGKWVGPAGWVRPFDHPALETTAVIDGPRLCLTVAERCENPDFVRFETDSRSVTVEAGPLGRSPVYVRRHKARLTGSWRAADLMDHLPFDAGNGRELVRQLTRRHRYGSDTVFTDIRRLTERAQISADEGGMRVRYPDGVERPMNRRVLREGVDPVMVMGKLIRGHLEGRAVDGVELSGGADSALVASEIASSDRRLRSFGLVMPGELGVAQSIRRAAIVDALKLADTEVPAVRHPPFGAGRRSGPHDPVSSYYCEAFDALAAAAASQDVRTMAVGFGGDELMACASDAMPTLTDEDLPEWLSARVRGAVEDIDADVAPATYLHTPTLMALASHAPGLLASGIWPVAPLADSALTRFCYQLPEELVTDKKLIRQLLAQRIPKRVAYQPSPESFRPLMQIGMRRTGLRMLEDYLKRGMLLADIGYVEPSVLRTVVTKARRAAVVDSRLADVLRLEHGLRRVWSEL